MEYIPVNREGIDLSTLQDEEESLPIDRKRKFEDLEEEEEEDDDDEVEEEKKKTPAEKARQKRLLMTKIRLYQQRFKDRIKDIEIPENLHNLEMEELEMLAEDLHVCIAGHNNLEMIEKMVFGGARIVEDISCKAGFDVRGLSLDLACDAKSRDVVDEFAIDNMDIFVMKPATSLCLTLGSLWLQRYKINKDSEYASNLLQMTIDEKDFYEFDDL